MGTNFKLKSRSTKYGERVYETYLKENNRKDRSNNTEKEESKEDVIEFTLNNM